VTVCRQTAEGVYEDEIGRYNIHEQFRATLVFVKQQGRWMLAGLQLSSSWIDLEFIAHTTPRTSSLVRRSDGPGSAGDQRGAAPPEGIPMQNPMIENPVRFTHLEKLTVKTSEETMTHVIDKDELPHSGTAHKFEGYHYGDTNVSFFLTDGPPGSGPKLHAHPYEEVFVVQEGELTFTVGDDIVEATSGQILVVPAGVPHKFVNTGTGRARHIDIHTSQRMITEWLEDD
jgi:mannose-6-phosphate isomerase-like protein (cupin superfamily)